MNTALTLEERAYNYETMQHIHEVARLLHMVCKELMDRADVHDATKLEEPELSGFMNAKPLAGMTYGSKEFEEQKKGLKEALDHHYAKNSHHPEHYKDGLNDMTLIDLVELFVDWKSSSIRHSDGNLLKSIDINSNRFNMSPQLTRIFQNTALLFDRI